MEVRKVNDVDMGWPRTAFSTEVVEAEVVLIEQGWGYAAIARELHKQFPNRRTPAAKTVMHHISQIKPREPRGRIPGNYRPRGHSQPPAPIPQPEPVPEANPRLSNLDSAFEQIVRDAFRAANNMPGIIKALEDAHLAVGMAHQAIEEVRRLLGVNLDERES